MSAPAVFLRSCVLERFELLISDHLIAEVKRTLAKPFFLAHCDPDVRIATLEALRKVATQVTISATVVGIATHPEDDLVLATAVSANADYLVTGDKQLLRLGSIQGITIINPRDFLTLIEQQADSSEDVPEP